MDYGNITTIADIMFSYFAHLFSTWCGLICSSYVSGLNQSILLSLFFFFLEADLRSRGGEFKGKSFIKEMLPG